MRQQILSTVALVTVLMLGCGPALSLHPLYTEEDVIFEPAILGTWGEQEDDGWTFQKSKKGNTYDVIIRFSGDPTGGADSLALAGHLIRLGDEMFMDVTSHESDLDPFLAIPVHAFLRLSLEGDSMGIAYLDDSWLAESIENKKIRIKHELVDDSILLTASPQELQELVKSCAEDLKAFEMEYAQRLK